jgi:predicted nucleic acid-binding protein
LDQGEAEAISLAIELKANSLLIDDRKGRNAARGRGIKTVGTLAVLEVAAERRLIGLPETIDRLRRTNFRISERMLQAALQRDRASRRD